MINYFNLKLLLLFFFKIQIAGQNIRNRVVGTIASNIGKVPTRSGRLELLRDGKAYTECPIDILYVLIL